VGSRASRSLAISTVTSGIYLSYRRAESAAYAGRLFDDLARHFGSASVFMDVQGGIARGQEFALAIESALNVCEVVLVVIGNTWATCIGEDGQRRLDNPKDWVRLEVAAALHRNVLVVPVLVGGAHLPDSASLPKELQPLCTRNACELSDLRWSYDVGELVKDVEKVVRPRKRLQILPVKSKWLRSLTGGAVILALLLGVPFVGSIAVKKALQQKYAVEERTNVLNEIRVPLSHIFDYIEDIGTWKEDDPEKIIAYKRKIDTEMWSSRPY
jgi:hypothetical protein